MFDELWSEIQDAPGEIFDLDIPELKDEKFDVNEYLNADYDYWFLRLHCDSLLLSSPPLMTLTDNQLDQLIDNYAERIVDEMDVKCLMQFVFDTIVENLRGKDEEEVLGEIAYVYDEDVIQELIESVTVE